MPPSVSFPKKVAPLDGEFVLVRYSMPWKRTAYRAIGAWMYLTSHRILLVPGPHEQLLGHKVWWAMREDIADVDTIDPSLKNLLVGGIRNMLKIELRDGSLELFNPYKPSRIAKEIRAWMSPQDGD